MIEKLSLLQKISTSLSSGGVKDIDAKELGKVDVTDPSKAVATQGSADRFEFSSSAQRLAQSANVDVGLSVAQSKQERMERIKAQIEAGTYQVNSRAIAEGMLKEALAFGKKSA